MMVYGNKIIDPNSTTKSGITWGLDLDAPDIVSYLAV